jgi:hypothetical protein
MVDEDLFVGIIPASVKESPGSFSKRQGVGIQETACLSYLVITGFPA